MVMSGQPELKMDEQIARALARVQDLSDLELAMLLALMSSQHPIIQTEVDALDDLETELQLAARQTFGLRSSSIRCTPGTSLNDFTRSLLSPEPWTDKLPDESPDANIRIPNIVVVRDLQAANRVVQMQVMELLKSKRIFTHTAVHSAPKHFMLLLVSAPRTDALVSHLRDYICLSHTHDPGDGFPNTAEAPTGASNEQEYVKPLLSVIEMEGLTTRAADAAISVEVMRYIQDIAVFLRMHRAVAAGATPLATQYLVSMCRSLAVLHGVRYVTPPLVALAARKVFRHRLVLVSPAAERSMQYGSDVASVEEMLKGYDAESVIEDVLSSVECPL